LTVFLLPTALAREEDYDVAIYGVVLHCVLDHAEQDALVVLPTQPQLQVLKLVPPGDVDGYLVTPYLPLERLDHLFDELLWAVTEVWLGTELTVPDTHPEEL